MKRVLLLSFLLCSCTHLHVQRGDQSVATATSQSVVRLHNLFFGLFPTGPLPPEKVLCPNGRVEALDFRMSASDVALTTVTFGLYMRHRVSITCSNLISRGP